jgi:hypothetical protein
MSVPAEQAVRAWINGLTGLVGDGNPLSGGAYTLSQRSPADGAYGIVARNPEGVPGALIAEDSEVMTARVQVQVFAGTSQAAENAAGALRDEIDRLNGRPEPCGDLPYLVLVTDNRNGPFYVPGTPEEFCFQVGADFVLTNQLGRGRWPHSASSTAPTGWRGLTWLPPAWRRLPAAATRCPQDRTRTCGLRRQAPTAR